MHLASCIDQPACVAKTRSRIIPRERDGHDGRQQAAGNRRHTPTDDNARSSTVGFSTAPPLPLVGGITSGATARLASDETVVLLHPPLPSAGVSIEIKKGVSSNDNVRSYTSAVQPHPSISCCCCCNLKCTMTTNLAVGETVILLHPPLPLVGVSIAMERDRQQNDSLANG